MIAMYRMPVALFLIGLLAAIGAPAQGSGAAPSATASSAPATGQRPVRPVGIIDFYGLRQLSANQLRSVITLKVGDSITSGDHSFYAVPKQELMAKKRDPELLKMLRQQALPSLVEMAHWSSRGHAFWAFMILGDIAGVSDNDIDSHWSRNDLEPVIKAARGR